MTIEKEEEEEKDVAAKEKRRRMEVMQKERRTTRRKRSALPPLTCLSHLAFLSSRLSLYSILLTPLFSCPPPLHHLESPLFIPSPSFFFAIALGRKK